MAIFKQSKLARKLLFQRRPLKEPLTYIWWRRYTPSNDVPTFFVEPSTPPLRLSRLSYDED